MFKSSLASTILAAIGLASASFATAPELQSYATGRYRQPGKAKPAGSKLARKAARGQIGIIHGGLSPRMPDRFPFSAKRR